MREREKVQKMPRQIGISTALATKGVRLETILDNLEPRSSSEGLKTLSTSWTSTVNLGKRSDTN